ncbi:MAG TPA: bifunctional adenosylcobinamide kinase/adenosylcobinamide-phosphate guanylyltransferase [Solirubrobacteraceae bacterium]|jgi:histidinol-phosphate/aromatic aminotransferase/cobyric acid decarboxylase-like protein/adenosyl cobinamide kinase/adenosyl cobinamide phosphate guanylyltransferase|nr:bifunctional adenosylcobinamide kinase/adenosylcobinamide-phosphate guanylyltransferase [Solirubrobacteraceae bacterium]
MPLSVVIGGTRSGKSAHAERLALQSGLPVRYVATADGSDRAMAERIAVHRARRPPSWTTAEAGPALADAFAGSAGECVLLDGLGPWIASALHDAGAFGEAPAPDKASASDLLASVRARVLHEVELALDAALGAGAAIVVAEQAGEGLLPPDAAARAWLDLLGEATQRFAACASRVELVVAGRALVLGDEGHAVGDGPAGRSHDGPGGADRRHARARTADAPNLRHHGDRDVRPGDADHAVNVVAGGPPPWLCDALRDALESGVDRYPDDRDATAALADLHGRDPDEIVVCNGAAEALWLLPAALRPRLAACVHPGFTESEAALRAHGVPVTRVHRDPDHGFALDPAAIPDEADLVIAGNPASPSGTLDPAHALLALRRPDRVVVVDEAFMDLVPGEPGSLVREPLDDVVVVRSLTKALAIPGLRAGYAVAAPALAARLRAMRPPWSANALALAALAATARRPGALAAIAERAAAERDDLAARLAAVSGLRTWPTAANFCLIEVADGPTLVAALRARSIAVRPAASFPGLGQGHIRITARAPHANALLVLALEEALAACCA